MTLISDIPVITVDLHRHSRFDALRSTVAGEVAEPGDPAYQDLVTPWNVAVAMRPAAVVQRPEPRTSPQTVRFAGEHGLQVGVQATGHGAASVARRSAARLDPAASTR